MGYRFLSGFFRVPLFLRGLIFLALLYGSSLHVYSQVFNQNITVCPNGGIINIGQNGGLSNGGTWTNLVEPTFNYFGDSHAKLTTVRNLDIGITNLRYIDGNGAVMNSNITNYKVFAGDNQTLCATGGANNVQLDGSNPNGYGSGLWTITGGNPSNVTIADPTAYNTSLTITAPGTYTFQWQINFAPSIVCGGTFASGAGTVTITVTGPNLVVAGEPATPVCPGSNVVLTASGGASYLWENGSILASRTVTPFVMSNYTVTATDAWGCKAVRTITIRVNSLFTLSSSAASYCAGTMGVILTLSGSEVGVNYQLRKGGVNDGAPIAGTGAPLTWNNKLFGTYTILATNTATGCTMTMGNVTVTENPLPIVNAGADVYGCGPTSFNLTATGANTYMWSGGETTPTITVTPATTTTYTVTGTITATGCSNSDAVLATIFPIPVKYNVNGTGFYCQGIPGVTVSLSGSEAATTYQLYKDGIPFGLAVTGTGGVLSWSNKTAATYTIRASNAFCNNTMNGSAVVGEVALPAVYTLTGATSYCANLSGVTLTLSGSQLNINYNLKRAGVVVSTIPGTGAALNWPNMTAGTYTVDAVTVAPIACTTPMNGSVTVVSNAIPVVNAGADVAICSGKSAQLGATGGVTYSWAPATGLNNTGIWNPVASPTATTLYTVTATDNNGCVASDQIQVTVRANPDVIVTPNSSICKGQNAILTATDNIAGNGETYLWNTGSSNNTITVSPTTTTTYSVTITDVNGCTNNASTTVTVNPVPGVNAGSDKKVCQGSNVTLTGTGTADTWYWSNDATTASTTVSPAVTSNYILKGSFAATGCYSLDTVKVTVNNLPAVSFTLNGGMNTQFCSNGALVTLAGAPAGGLFTSSVPASISGSTFNPVVAGVGNRTITYSYTDANACVGTSVVSVDVVAPPVVTMGGLNASYCNTEAPFTVTGNPLENGSGTFGTWTFSGPGAALTNNGNGTCTINPAAITVAGNYNLTYQVANSSGCINTKTQTFALKVAPTVNFVGLPVSTCQSTAPMTLTGNQGIAGTFSGLGITDNANGTATFNPSVLLPNNYIISFTYQDPVTTCQSTANKTVTVKPMPTSYATTGGGAFCENTAGVPVGLSNSVVGTNYELFLDGFTTSQIVPGTGAAISFGNKTTAGTYTVRATTLATSCLLFMSGNAVVVKNPLPLDAQVLTGAASVCPNTSQNYTVPAVTNATTHIWSLPANASITAGAGTNNITVLFAANAASGNISVYGQNACGNGGSSSLAITIKPLPGVPGVITGKATVCQKESAVTYTIAAIANATSYTWTVPSGATIASGQGTTQILVNFGVTANSGNVTVRGDNSCGSGSVGTKAITVVATPQLTLNAPSGQITCSNTSVTVSATSSTGGATYAWTAINGGNITAGANTSSATGNAAGKYIVVVTEPVNACTSTDTSTVVSDFTAPQNINIVSTNGGIVTCSVPQITLTASTTSIFPVSYTWTASAGGNIVSGGNTAAAIVDKAGTYQVDVKNLNTGCITSKSIIITEQKVLPNISVVNPETEKITCTVASVGLTGSSTTPGATFSWTGPGITAGANTATPTANAVGVYTLTVAGPNGCQSNATVQVLNDNTLPTVTVNTNPANINCTNATVSLSGSSTTPGATLLWTGPGIVSGSTTTAPVVNVGGVYTLTVTHPTTGCTDSKTVTVVQNTTVPTVTFPVMPATITCALTTVSIQGNTSATNKTYLWTTANGTIVSGAATATVVVSKAGNYTLKVTDTDNGCQGTNTIAVSSDLAIPNASIAAPGMILCSQPTINLAGSSTTIPVTVNWTTADGTITAGATSFAPTVSKAGTYVMTVTNTTNNCVATASTLVTENKTNPAISINKTPASLNCFSTTSQLNGTALNSTLLWTGPGGATITNPTSPTPTVNMGGRYYLTATGTNGCTSKDSTDVASNYAKPLNVTINAPGTLSCTNPTLILTGNSTTVGASYKWTSSNGGTIISGTTANTVTVSTAGDYKMVVTHPTTFCKDSAIVSVTQNISVPTISFPVVPATITCTLASSALSSNVLPAGSTLLWTGPGSISDPSISNPTVNKAGSYTLQATHPVSGCKTTSVLVVAEDKTLPDVSIAAPASVTCTAPNATLDATTTVVGYTAAWTTTNGAFSGPTNLIDAIATKDGLYTLTLTKNSNGCTASANALVTANNANPGITIDPNPDKLTCAVMQVELYGSSSTAGSSLAWTGPGVIVDPNTQRPKVSTIGVFTLTVTGTNGCISTGTVTVAEDKTTPPVPTILAPANLTCTVKTTNVEVSPLLANVDYLWTTAGTGNIINPTSAVATVDAIGTYTVRVTNRTSGCTNQNNIVVAENKALPAPAIIGGPYEISCATTSLQLNGNTSTGINPLWSATAGGHVVSNGNTLLPTIDAAGDYTLTTTHAVSGCTAAASVTVTKDVNVPSLTIDAFPKLLTCTRTQDTLSGQPTEAGTTFTWTANPGHIVSGAATNNPIVDQPGVYILQVTKTATGCVRTASIEVKQDITPPQVILGTPQQLTCTRTQIQLDATSPNPAVSYSWTTAGAGSIKAGDEVVRNPIVYTAATYTVTVKDLNNNCTTVSNIVATEDKAIPNINVNKTPANITCTVKQVSLSGSSVTPNVNYLWTGPGNISNVSSTTPSVDATGNYTLKVTSSINGCFSTDVVTVASDLAVPNIWVDINPAVLNCANTTVQVKGNSATPGVTYLWSGPGTISDATLKEPFVNAPGVYQLTVTSSANGCTSTLPVTVTKNIALPGAPVSANAYACYGAPAATLTAIGNSIQWYNSPVLGIASRVQTGASFTPASATAVGDYYFYVTQTDAVSMCEGPATQITYSVKALPAAPVTIDNSICEGSANPSLQASGTNIKWYSTPGGALLASGNTYTPPASVNTAGTYSYFATQTDALGCESSTKAAALTINAIPAKPVLDKLTAGVCYGSTNTTFNATGTNLKWYASAALPAPIATGSAYKSLETVAASYNYYITQTSAAGCVSPYETVTFTIQPLPQPYTVTGGGVYCADLNGVSVGLNNSQLNVSYKLLLNGTTIVNTLNGTGAALDFGLQKPAGNYTVTATDLNSCTANMTGGVSIVANPLPGASGVITGSTTVCEGASNVSYAVPAIANATSYVWSLPAGATINSGLNSNNITIAFSVGATTGNINVYGQNGCGNGIVSPNLQVVVSPLPAAATNIKFIGKNNSICLGDTGVVYEVDPIANATSYNWVLPAGASITSGANTRQIKVYFAPTAAQGAQVVKVRGVNACGTGAYSADYAITVYPNPSVNAGIDQNICSDQTTLAGSAIPVGGTGLWQLVSGSATITNNSINNSNVTLLMQGDNLFSWTITENGCVSMDTVKIRNNKLTVEAGSNLPVCLTNVTLSGSALPVGTTGMWTVTSGFASFTNASQPNAIANNFGYGDNILRWTVTKSGCNSYDSMTITNYRPSTPDAGADQTICTNQTWLNATQPVYGTGEWFLHSGAVTITNPLQRNSAITAVSSGKNVLVWKVTNQICSLTDTIVIWNLSNPVNAGYDMTLCDNRTTLAATAPPVGATGQWSVLQGSATFLDSKIYNTKISGLANGVNLLTWAITKGSCTNTDTVTLTNNMPSLANAGPDVDVPSSSTTLDGNSPAIGTGKWSVISGAATFADDTLYNTTVSGLNPGSNILRWSIIYKGCSTFDDVQITNGSLETIDAGQNQIICSNETQLEASRPLYGFGKWTVQKGSAFFEDNEQYNTRVFNLLPGDNVLKWSVTLSGVEFSDTVVITNNKPTAAVVGPDQALCLDSSVLTGNLPIDGTGRWTLEGGSANIVDPLKNDSKVTNLGSGNNTFRWTITKSTCVSSVLLIVANNKPTVAYAGLDQTICLNNVALMPNTPSIGTGEWSVVTGAGNFSGNTVSGLAPGTNTLRWTINNFNCSSSDDVVIISHKPTTANAGANMVICIDSISLSANKANSAIGETAHWTIMNGSGNIIDTTLNTSKVKTLGQNLNIFRWTINNNGCLSSSDIIINYAFIKADAGLDVTTCDNHLLMNANNPGIGAGEWSLVGGSGTAVFVNLNSPNSEVKNLDRGTNILRWTIRNFGCSSTDEVHIINNSPSTAFAGGDQNLCVSTTTLLANVPLIGKGVWSVLSGAGTFADTNVYNSSVSNIGTGVNTYRWTTSNNGCTSTDEVAINNNQPIGTFAGTEQTLCDDSTSLNANLPSIGAGAWSIIHGAGSFADAYSPISSVDKLAPDTNLLRWTVTNKQCVEYKEVKIINNAPTTANAGADRVICSDQFLLDGNIPLQGKGEWSVISGAGTFLNKTMYNSQVSNLVTGANIFRWLITKQGCLSYDDVSITNDLPTLPDAGNIVSVCDSSASMNANKPLIGSGSWRVLSGRAIIADSTAYNTMVSGLAQGSNYLRWTIKHNKCSLSDDVEVKNNLTKVYAGPDQTTYDSVITLTGNIPPRGVGQWSLNAGAGTIAAPNYFESKVSGLAEGLNTFIWSVDISGCVTSDEVQITYYKLPTASYIVSGTEGCIPFEVKFTKTTVEKYMYKWEFGENGAESHEENPTYTYTTPGNFTAKLIVTGPDGNPVVKETLIKVNGLPKADFDIFPSEVYIPGESIRCNNHSEGGATYQWDFGDGSTAKDANPSHTYSDSGLYSVKLIVSTQNNCTDSFVIENGVHVIDLSRIKFPGAFTPNPGGPSDGRYNRSDYTNDVFFPIILIGGITEYKMEIYSRWGVLLFESNDIEIGWDGYYKQKLMPEDVYVYKVTGRYNSGKKFTLAGDFMLLRNF